MDTKQLPLIGSLIITAVTVLILIIIWDNPHKNSTLTLYGNIDIRQADLGFRVFGRLKSLHFEEGDKVSKGDLLAELDEAPYRNHLKESEAKVLALSENLSYAQAQMERRSLLLEGNSVSAEDYQQSYFNQKTLQANLDQAKAALENEKLNLEDTKLFSPSDGVIFTRIREPGTILEKGLPVYSVAVNDPIWARAYVSETHLGNIYPGMPAEIYTDTKENPVYKGHVGFISPIAEFTPKNVETPDLRSNLVYQLRVYIDNPDRGLRQGMPVTIKLSIGRDLK